MQQLVVAGEQSGTLSEILIKIGQNFESKTESQLHEIMEPFIVDWKKVRQADLLNQIDRALEGRANPSRFRRAECAQGSRRPSLLPDTTGTHR